jgi:hypothetical protein
MAKSNKPRGPRCGKVRSGGLDWYCCCGTVRAGYPGAGKTRCHCAPIVGKNRVNTRAEVCLEAPNGSGKFKRVRCPKRRR